MAIQWICPYERGFGLYSVRAVAKQGQDWKTAVLRGGSDSSDEITEHYREIPSIHSVKNETSAVRGQCGHIPFGILSLQPAYTETA